MICKHISQKIFSNEPEFIFCTQPNGSKYAYLTQIILFTFNHLFAHS